MGFLIFKQMGNLGVDFSQNMQLQIAVKPLVLCCQLSKTKEELSGFATVILPFAELLLSLIFKTTLIYSRRTTLHTGTQFNPTVNGQHAQ